MNNFEEIVKKYFDFFPKDKERLIVFSEQICKNKDIFDRKNFTGHIVANSLIINNYKILTIFHNSLKMYIQPGGHIDKNDASILDAALREAEEETGINDLSLLEWHKQKKIPIFIESHLIPENLKKQEKQHYHHDFMYIFTTNTKNVNLQIKEVSDYVWVDIDTIININPDSFISKSLQRMFELKLL